MRAPPASNRPMIGARAFIAMSWILTIFCAWVSDSEPPNTVKSLANTNTVRPLTVPQPVTTPSPGIFVLVHAEVGRAVLDEHVELLERALVHQELQALARGELAALVLRLDARLAAAEPRMARRLSSFSRMSFMNVRSARPFRDSTAAHVAEPAEQAIRLTLWSTPPPPPPAPVAAARSSAEALRAARERGRRRRPHCSACSSPRPREPRPTPTSQRMAPAGKELPAPAAPTPSASSPTCTCAEPPGARAGSRRARPPSAGLRLRHVGDAAGAGARSARPALPRPRRARDPRSAPALRPAPGARRRDRARGRWPR